MFSRQLVVAAVIPLFHVAAPASESSAQYTGGDSEGREYAAPADSITDSRFELVLAAPNEIHVGKAATVELLLEAKAPFKCNDKYPLRFRFKETAGIILTHPTVGGKFARVSAGEAKMTLPFTPTEPGRLRVEGTFHFSVCTLDRCLMEKRDLGVEINVL